MAKDNSVADLPEAPTTQRAYTLRLRGKDKLDSTWRDALWTTHDAVNKGCRAFGDWLLTLRGGIGHELAAGKTPDDIRNQRILLALSWITVESCPSKTDSYYKFKIEPGNQVERLKTVLQKRELSPEEIKSWIDDCAPSLSAEIRDDAAWIDRSEAFDDAVKQIGSSLTREGVWDILEPFFGSRDAYLAPVETADDSEGDSAAAEEKAKDLVQKAGQWLSSRFGTGKGADFSRMSKVYVAIARWTLEAPEFKSGTAALAALAESLVEFQPKSKDASGILNLISGPGYKSATRNIIQDWEDAGKIGVEQMARLREIADADSEKCKANTGGKGRRPWSDEILKSVERDCGFTYIQKDGPARHSEFAVMLDHAARRVSIAHTWIKRAESERRQFKADAEKIADVPPEALKCLDDFCKERSGTSGANDAYRIRKRAVSGWMELVAKWGEAACVSPDDRIKAARELQDDPEIDKPGDIQLFEALSTENAVCVWKVNGQASAKPLLDYAAATDAQAKQQRFKVPAYRHPDPLSHPVFCDFGNSRWSIRFAVHDAVSKLEDARKTIERREAELAKANERLAKAKAPEKQVEGQQKIDECERDLAAAQERAEWLSSQHALSMGLWTGKQIDEGIPLFWSGKRLVRDLALPAPPEGKNAASVTRGDRLGRAASGVHSGENVRPLGLFELNDWNGRLQAPRAQLDEIAKRVEKHGWDAKAQKMRDHIRWLITFSAKLQVVGPWLDYTAKFTEDALAKPFISRKGEFAIKHASNDSRKGRAKLVLCRLPGLRVLAGDLGHRFAVACAAWEALSLEMFRKEIAGRRVIRGGDNPSDIFLHTQHTDERGNLRTVIYRRIGPDESPAPWARLDRQFVIKLQGEDRDARNATPDETEKVQAFEKELGRLRTEEKPLPKPVNELMLEAVNTARLALKRHADRARIACNLIATSKVRPGGKPGELDEAGRVDLLADVLELWHALASPGERWQDSWAANLWSQQFWSEQVPLRRLDFDSLNRQEIKNARARLCEQLKPIAAQLEQKPEWRKKLSELWAVRWHGDNGNAAKTNEKDGQRISSGTGWYARLRWLRDWIMPRGIGKLVARLDSDGRETGRQRRKTDYSKLKTAIRTGGLSLDRIALFKELYQIQKAFKMRPEPEDLRKNIPEKGNDALRDFGKAILDAMEEMRTNRVKQLSSRIAEAALGIGRIKISKKGKDPKRPREKRDEPCHAVVIENLTHYRPDDLQTRRENRQLMEWSSSKVKKFLSEACQLHGLHLREVPAHYTSQQDSRTGAPGMRCVDVSVEKFLTWKKQFAAAEKKVKNGEASARDNYLLKLRRECEKNPKSKVLIRIPLKGGDLLVSCRADSPAAKGLQADLNAAANIGLKALLDPDWPGAWWYVPCDLETCVPVEKTVKGSDVFKSGNALIKKSTAKAVAPKRSTKKESSEKKSDKKPNLWRDVSAREVDATPDAWFGREAYWKRVENEVVNILANPLEKMPWE